MLSKVVSFLLVFLFAFSQNEDLAALVWNLYVVFLNWTVIKFYQANCAHFFCNLETTCFVKILSLVDKSVILECLPHDNGVVS